MVSPWQNQSISTTSMMQQPDPHFTTLNNDEDLVVPLPERGVAGFVCKLYQSLEAPDGGEKYARWMKHNGKDMFIIDCIPKFTETVLPKLFKHCKFASFVRQLNIYGFQRDTDARKSKDSRDKEICRWYHTHFRPGRRDLFHLIRRKAPRYSRRKRIKMDQEEDKTGVNSGDESDQENGDDHTIHQISPSGTSAATTPTMANNNVNVVYSSSPPSAMFTDSHGLIDTSPLILSLPTSSSSTTAVSSPPPPPPPPPPPLPPSQQHQQQQQPFLWKDHHIRPSNCIYWNNHKNPKRIIHYNKLNSLNNNYNSCKVSNSNNFNINNINNINIINNINKFSLLIQIQVFPPPPPPPPPPSSSSTSSSSPSTLYQEELKAHISRLQHDYQQMHTYFTNELGKAHKQIEIQQLRTEFLERSLRGDR
ncbi:HSF-type DNA-binding-domain-containing protein [Chlamydoabsidia padenii]|nr:HSF-type DNA-binding-domain-containing protein [Chlamydoabsidia padenii]